MIKGNDASFASLQDSNEKLFGFWIGCLTQLRCTTATLDGHHSFLHHNSSSMQCHRSVVL